METTPAYAPTILTVDDDPAMLDLVARFLSSHGLRIVSTSDPEKVVSLAIAENPRLIISDIDMPGMNGLALLKLLKETAATREFPVVLLTSSSDPADMQEGLNSGAEAYLAKPVNWELAWPKIQAILLRS